MGNELGQSKRNQDATQNKVFGARHIWNRHKKTNKYKNIQRDMVSALYL